MSFLDRIRAVNGYDPKQFRAFRVAGVQLGAIKHGFAETLSRWPAVFRVEDHGVSISNALDNPEIRTRAVRETLLTLRDEGHIKGWRNEPYPVNRSYTDPPYLVMERAATPFFGVRAYGVHLNGFVRHGNHMQMWIARRARDVHNEPGKLDQLVAGGQPVGLSLEANVVKECREEAGIPSYLAKLAKPVGAISYCRETSYGLKPDVIYNFDLELAPDFVPTNTDGEVEAFYLWPIERVLETVRESGAFKLNCAVVIIDFLIRHGFIPPDHPDYMDILYGLLSRPEGF